VPPPPPPPPDEDEEEEEELDELEGEGYELEDEPVVLESPESPLLFSAALFSR
jgi:hypothetical protein